MQADTIIPDYHNPQSLNRYSYVENNPLKFVDYSGNYKVEYDVVNWNDMNNIVRIDITRIGTPLGLPGFESYTVESGTISLEYEQYDKDGNLVGYDYQVDMDNGKTKLLNDIITEGEQDNKEHTVDLGLSLIPGANSLKKGTKVLRYGKRIETWYGYANAFKSWGKDDPELEQDILEAVPVVGNLYGLSRHGLSMYTYKNLVPGRQIPEYEGYGMQILKNKGSTTLFHMGGYCRPKQERGG